MYCTKCGTELREDVNFCSQCGDRTRTAPPPPAPKVLRLDKRNKKIAGVCAGFARYLEVDVVLVRVIWLVLAFCTGGMGFLAYIAAWIVVPSDEWLAAGDAVVQHAPVRT